MQCYHIVLKIIFCGLMITVILFSLHKFFMNSHNVLTLCCDVKDFISCNMFKMQ